VRLFKISRSFQTHAHFMCFGVSFWLIIISEVSTSCEIPVQICEFGLLVTVLSITDIIHHRTLRLSAINPLVSTVELDLKLNKERPT